MTAESGVAWDPQANGPELLKHLGELALQAETNLWTSSALFGAAEGVLLLGFFSLVGALSSLSQAGMYSAEFSQYWQWAIGITGIMLSVAWAGVSWLLLERRRTWASKARELQSTIGIPDRFSPWGLTPSLTFAWEKMLFIISWLPFAVMWLLLLNALAAGP